VTYALLSHRRRLVSLQTSAKNRLQSVLHRLNLRPPKGKLFAQKQRAWVGYDREGRKRATNTGWVRGENSASCVK
jgi:hypothetical protein